jgi:hypothetical protein
MLKRNLQESGNEYGIFILHREKVKDAENLSEVK